MARTPENLIQREIMAALGAEPDLILFRNSVGSVPMYHHATGRTYHVTFGLGVGSPDVVGILRIELPGRSLGQWFCLEVKRPGEHPRPEQEQCAQAWRRFGAFVATVTSVGEARAAFMRARKGEHS
jgi:hypothetical protein